MARDRAAWLAAAPLWLLIRGERPWVAFRRAFLAAWLAYACVFWWLFIVITVYGRAPAFAGVAGTLFVAAYCGLCVSVGAAVTAWLAPHAGRSAVLLLPAAWILADRFRALESGAAFPWAFLGYAAHADPALRGLASLTGVYGLSFAFLLGGLLLAERRIAGAVALVAALHVVGWLALPGALAPAPGAPVRVAMIQGNIPQSLKWDPAFEKQNYEIQLGLTLEALRAKPDVVTWPEAAFPGFLLTPAEEARYPGLVESQLEFRDPLLAVAREAGTAILLGGLGLMPVPGRQIPNLYNSAFVISRDGAVADRHDKTVLVPFGEYVPLRALFGSLDAVASGLADVGDLTPGGELRALRGLGRLGDEHAPAVLICYEVVYPGVVRRAVREGARLLLNTTNDAWYGRSSAPHQFLAIAKLRSAEHGLPMLRDANTGVTAVIDASGAVLEETEIFEARVLTADVPPARAGATVYTRAGDWPLWASAALLAFFGGKAVVGRRRR